MKGLVILCLFAAVLSQQIPPIPTGPDGYAYGPETTNYTLDVFYDHLCSDSAAAYPGLFTYWANNQNWLRLVVHIYPLPYHYYAFIVGRAGRFIQLNYPSNFTSFTTWFFQHQTKYLSLAQQWNQATLYDNLATDTQTATGVPFSLVEAALNNATYDYNLRISWKYAASKAITGTPQYLVNGIWAPETADFITAQDWQDFFDGLS